MDSSSDQPENVQSGRVFNAVEPLTAVSRDEDELGGPLPLFQAIRLDSHMIPSSELPTAEPRPIEVGEGGESVHSTGHMLNDGHGSRSDPPLNQANPIQSGREVDSAHQRRELDPVAGQPTVEPTESTRSSSLGSTRSQNVARTLPQSASPMKTNRRFNFRLNQRGYITHRRVTKTPTRDGHGYMLQSPLQTKILSRS